MKLQWKWINPSVKGTLEDSASEYEDRYLGMMVFSEALRCPLQRVLWQGSAQPSGASSLSLWDPVYEVDRRFVMSNLPQQYLRSGTVEDSPLIFATDDRLKTMQPKMHLALPDHAYSSYQIFPNPFTLRSHHIMPLIPNGTMSTFSMCIILPSEFRLWPQYVSLSFHHI